MRLKNKYAVIIGGAVGIGGGITRKFAEEGCNLFVTYHGDKEKIEAEKLNKELKNYNIEIHFEYLDIQEKDQIEDIFKKIRGSTNHLDIAVNNAGVTSAIPFLEVTEKDWDFVLDINAKGMFFCCQEEARIMVDQNYGKIINTASMASKTGFEFFSHYSASKYAVLGLTFTMAIELAKYNINVNAVCPGVIYTDMLDRFFDASAKLRGISKSELIESGKEEIPLKRFGTPKDVAGLFLFLASDDADYITMQAYNVDGGMEND